MDAAAAACASAFDAMRARFGLPPLPRRAADHRRVARRVTHLRGTDPAGSWVADAQGEVVGLSQAFVREGLWVLSLLGVAPVGQGRGLGRALLEAALGHGGGDGPGMIQSSRDPAAISLYSRAGFSLHPAMAGFGVVGAGGGGDRRAGNTGGRRAGDAGGGGPSPRSVSDGRGELMEATGDPRALAVVAGIDRATRGAARSEDLAFLLGEPGNSLLLWGDQAYAVATDDRVVVLGARSEEAAVHVLRAALDRTPEGASVQVNWVTAEQQWAVTTLVEMGIDLHPTGPVMLRSRPVPCPYLPSGGYG